MNKNEKMKSPFIKKRRLAKVTKELNIGKDSVLEYLKYKGEKVENNPNAKVSNKQYRMLKKEFAD